ncbi:hypothetical protein J2Z60_000186 [Lactobacillus colini]|uniref:DUF2479 domain-containing protein n=1 Tax=Lactobacillus colini TaxID=1819254 RepID=A0ABS4MBG7_9LACO|nr:hypothetical protein [Lactobacillus colini]MBP2057024.1 hypothetical protein [Lactobacillus colini]
MEKDFLICFLDESNFFRKEVIMSKDVKVYISGVFGGRTVDCEVANLSTGLAGTETNWPFVFEAPDPSFSHPKYDWSKGEWVDQSEASQAQKLTSLQDAIDGLKKQAGAIVEKQKTIEGQNATTAEMVNAIPRQFGVLSQQITTVMSQLNQLTSYVSDSKEAATNE